MSDEFGGLKMAMTTAEACRFVAERTLDADAKHLLNAAASNLEQLEADLASAREQLQRVREALDGIEQQQYRHDEVGRLLIFQEKQIVKLINRALTLTTREAETK